MPHLHEIISLLNIPQPNVPVQFGRAEPFGETRMKVVELTLVLLRSRLELVDKALAELNVLSLMLDCFFNYPWNNMLHGLVESIIRTVLDSESKILIDALFDKGKLVQKFIQAYDYGDELNNNNNNLPLNTEHPNHHTNKNNDNNNNFDEAKLVQFKQLHNNNITSSKQIYRAGYMG